MFRPIPRPPCERVISPSAWRKRSNTNRRKSGSIPCPVSETRIRALGFSLLERNIDTALFRRELHGVGEKIPDDLLETIGIGVGANVGIETGLEGDALGGRGRLDCVDRGLDDRGKNDIAADSAAVLPVVMRETSRRSSISFVCALTFRSMTSRPRIASAGSFSRRSRLGPADDGIQRRAQLVREGGEEFVLQAVRLPIPGEDRVLDGDGGDLHELHEDRLVVRR